MNRLRFSVTTPPSSRCGGLGRRRRRRRARPAGRCAAARTAGSLGDLVAPSSTRTSERITPPSRTMTRSASTIASSTSWVTSSTAGWCRSHSWRRSACIRIRVRASSAPNGSSASSSCGIAHQRAGQGGALLLTARQLVRPGALAALEADLGQRSASLLVGVGGPGVGQAEGDVVEDPSPRQQPGVLEDHRHLVRDRRWCPSRPPRGRARRGPAAACSCRCRCDRAGPRTRPAPSARSRPLSTPPASLKLRCRFPDAGPHGAGQLSSVRRHVSAFLSMTRTVPSASRPSTA